MEKYRKTEILQIVEEEGVEFIRLQFTDMFGSLKNVAVPVSCLEKAMDDRCTIDLASLNGFAKEEETELYLKPDFSTFTILPWRPQNGKVARFLCDVCTEDGSEYELNPRLILKRALEKAEKQGYTLEVNPECEFFLFHTDDDGMPTTVSHERAGYLDTSPIDLGENTRRDIILTLEEMGYQITSSHHEIAPAQHEIDFAFEDALSTADKVMTFKMAVRTIAKRYGLHATFMPRPRQDVNGSGLHLHMRLLKNGRNVFTGENGELSTDGEAFLAGILGHVVGMTAVFNPLVNSYKRLVPGYDAPIYIAWSPTSNRSSLIRIPSPRGEGTRIELRCPDSAMNPYLALAACLQAGLNGIENEMQLPPCVQGNLFGMKPEELENRHVERIPETLGDAIETYRDNAFIREVLGEHIYVKYLEAKEEEWRDFRAQVTDWEVNQYLYKY